MQVSGNGGVPADAAGAALYIGAANGSQAGYVSAYPTGGTASSFSILSYTSGETDHDLYLGAVSASGQLTLVNQGAAAVDLMVGVQGYLVSPSASEAGAAYQDVAESRIVDTRSGNGGVPATPVPPGGSITFSATGVDLVPSTGVPSVAESVAALNATQNGWLSIYPAGTTDPNAPGVNFYGGDAQDNDLSTPLLSAVSPTGKETITNHSSGTVDIVVSLRGYYSAATVPDAPDQADAGVQNGTATIYWNPPPTDGGAAITSYQVTVYNPDGTVNQASSLPPGATTSTASGLTGAGNYTVAVVAVNSVGSSASVPVTINAIPTGWSAPSTQDDEYQVDMQVDQSTGDVTLVSATDVNQTYAPDGTMTASTTTDQTASSDVWNGLSPAIGTFDCVKKTGSGVHAHTPWHDSKSNSKGSLDFMHEGYTEANARQLYGSNGSYWTFQDMICSTGGGDAKGNWHTWFAGTAVTISRTAEVKIGQHWGTHATKVNSQDVVTTQLDFQLSAGVATIGASVNITPGQGTYGGDIQNDGRFPGYNSAWNSFKKNRVNVFFVSPHNWPWDGTGSFEGNDGEVLYEWPMGSTGSKHIVTDSLLRLFCSTTC